jgi:hypothetical protein
MKYLHLENLSKRQKKYLNIFLSSKVIKNENLFQCPLCKDKNLRKLFTNDRYGIKSITVFCKNCSLVFQNPRMTPSTLNYFYTSPIYRGIYTENYISEASKSYKDFLYIKKKICFKKYYRNLFLDYINSFNFKYKSVCDIGAGKGLGLLNFKNNGKKISGTEPLAFNRKLAENYGIKLSPKIKNIKKSDLIILSHVLEHMSDLELELRKIYNLSKKYLFIEVPGIVTRFSSIQIAHNYYFSKYTLGALLEKNGFKCIDMQYAKDNQYILGIFKKVKQNYNMTFGNKIEVLRIFIIYYIYFTKWLLKKIIKL